MYKNLSIFHFHVLLGMLFIYSLLSITNNSKISGWCVKLKHDYCNQQSKVLKTGQRLQAYNKEINVSSLTKKNILPMGKVKTHKRVKITINLKYGHIAHTTWNYWISYSKNITSDFLFPILKFSFLLSALSDIKVE